MASASPLRWMKKDRALGIAREKRRYDLPLNKGPGAAFLAVLIALMSFLAVLALASSFALSGMTAHWSTGLENSATVEVPATAPDGTVLTPEKTKAATAKIASLLENHPAVDSVRVLDDGEIRDLVRPWLDTDSGLLDKVPLPGLIAVNLDNKDPGTLETLNRKIREIVPSARLDAHEEWLRGLLRFTKALQFAAALLTGIVGLTAVAAVAGAVRARMDIHRAEIEILHLMGAADGYVARQFQRHALLLALAGGMAGLAAGAAAIAATGAIAGDAGESLLPDFRLSLAQIAALASIPALAAAIAALAARRTVLRVLGRLP